MDHAERNFISAYLSESETVLSRFAQDPLTVDVLQDFAERIVQALESGGKVMIAGNGGSAADAQHIAGEFLSRLFFDRAPLPAIALTTDTSVLTAVGNDYGYEEVFSRQIKGLARKGDALLAISTSGTSKNIVTALQVARERGVTTLGFCGADPRTMDHLCDVVLRAPSAKTAIIQQIHIVAAHIVCGLVEQKLFRTKGSPA